jgi:hypothetical protein
VAFHLRFPPFCMDVLQSELKCPQCPSDRQCLIHLMTESGLCYKLRATSNTCCRFGVCCWKNAADFS